MAAAEEQVRKWREKEDVQLPDFTTERIRHLRNTIHYPAEGTVKS